MDGVFALESRSSAQFQGEWRKDPRVFGPVIRLFFFSIASIHTDLDCRGTHHTEVRRYPVGVDAPSSQHLEG